MCYENEVCCKFTCGHGFCNDCTKSWYMKGKSTCPMCRASMCFKGITKMKKLWYQEKQEETYKNLVTLIFEELMGEYDDIVLDCVGVVQDRFRYTMLRDPGISCEALDIILRMTWIDVDDFLSVPDENVYEPRTFERYLMVGKDREVDNYLEVQYRFVKNV